jgi:hypothetical protein
MLTAGLAVAEGFEPSDGGYPSHAFEACSLGRSDTPPAGSIPANRYANPIAIRPLADRPVVTDRLIQSLASEERLERRRALVGQHSPAHLRPMRQPAVAHHVPQ